jgi:hypothetical protein
MSESWLGAEFCFTAGPLEWGTHEPPSFIVNQRQAERRRRRKYNKIELEFYLPARKKDNNSPSNNYKCWRPFALSGAVIGLLSRDG